MSIGSVFINNLDDFITPSQACINPLVANNLVKGEPLHNNANTVQPINPANASRRKHGRVTIALEGESDQTFFDSSVEPDLIRQKTVDSRTVATVSLNDCLACSGCVTSAEAILIQEQSLEKFIRYLKEDMLSSHDIVVQLSPNSVASIAAFLRLSSYDLFLKVATMFKRMGVKYVLDSATGGDVALIEAREEFLLRWNYGKCKEWKLPERSIAVSSTAMNTFDGPSYGKEVNVSSSSSIQLHRDLVIPNMNKHCPVLTSHCPGWVCYAEKTAPQSISYLSTVKSAQQIVGSVIKSILKPGNELYARRREIERTDIDVSLEEALWALDDLSLEKSKPSQPLPVKAKKVMVVSVQPCFDKKLEASRKDFYHSESDLVEVDMVLSTTELWQIIEKEAWAWRQREVAGCGDTNSMQLVDCQSEDEYDVDFDADIESSGPTRSKRKKSFTMSSESKTIPPNPSMEASESSTGSVASDALKSTFSHVFSFLSHLPTDAPHGADEIERLFRSHSLHAEQLMTAAESNSASGGYVEYVFRFAAQKMFGVNLWQVPLAYKEGRNPDFMELDINAYLSPGQLASSTSPTLKFARAYGFRNIQSVMIKMKKGQCDYDLIEIMACPSGCNNGGGQLKSLSSITPLSYSSTTSNPSRTESPLESRLRISSVDKVFYEQLVFQYPEESLLVRYLYDSRRLRYPLSELALQLLHTRFHAVPKLETITPLAAKW